MILRWPCGRAGPAQRCHRGSAARSAPPQASGRSRPPSRPSPSATPGSPCPCRPHRRTAPRVLGGPGACWCRRGMYLQSAHRRPACGADRPAVSCSSTPSGRSEGPSGPGSLFNRRPDLPVCSHADVSGISQVSRQSIPCLCPALATPAEPTIPRLLDGFVDAVPALPTAKTSALNEFRGSVTRLWHPLPTLQESCCHHPCKARFRLAGLAFTGRASNPLDRCKRFQIIHPPFLDLAWRKRSFIAEPPSPFTSLDHLIGAGKQHLRDHDAESLRRPEIDHEFEFRRRPNGKIRRLRTAKDATGIFRGTPEQVRGVHSIG